MYAEINAAVQSAKVLFEVVKANKELTEFNELNAAVGDLNAKLVSVTTVTLAGQEKQAALTERVRDLEKELMKLKNWEREAKRYQLTEFGPRVFAFSMKPEKEKGDPFHILCTACFQKRQKGYLQFLKQDGYGDHFKCDLCSNEIVSVSHDYLFNSGRVRCV